MFPSSLIDVREKHNFNLNNLNLWLEKNLTSFGKIGLIKQFFGGQSNPTFFLSSDNGEKLILRKKPPGKLLPSAHAVDREYKVITALNSIGYPVPKTFSLCLDESVIGTIFYVVFFTSEFNKSYE